MSGFLGVRFIRVLFYSISLSLFFADMAGAENFDSPSVHYYQKDQRLDVFRPSNWSTDGKNRLPAVVFFHGGAWVAGSRSQFHGQANWLIERAKLVVISVGYPTNANPIESTSAALAAMCWLGSHADELGIDVKKVVVAGSSAGGQLAISTVTLAGLPAFDRCTDNAQVRVAGLLLFNPVVDLRGKWEQRFGMNLKGVSPMQSLASELPPALIVHGTGDRIAPVESVREFVTRARELGARKVELVEFAGRDHGFFNSNKQGDREAVLEASLAFIRGLGWVL